MWIKTKSRMVSNHFGGNIMKDTNNCKMDFELWVKNYNKEKAGNVQTLVMKCQNISQQTCIMLFNEAIKDYSEFRIEILLTNISEEM